MYNRDDDGSFNYDAIARGINVVIGMLKENNSVVGVNWAQTNYDQESPCIKLFLENNPTEAVDITLDDIRMFNLEKIRRAFGRNVERHLAGRWEVFKGQRFAGILSGEHSLLDKNTNINGLVQKFTVKTPFGESELQVSYNSDNGVLREKNRMIYNDNFKCFLTYDTIMDYFSKFTPGNQEKITLAINDYVSKKVEDRDIDKLNSGETPLVVFNDKVGTCDIGAENEQDGEFKKKKSAMSDFAAILMFCENSNVRVNSGGKWERGFLNTATELGIDIALLGYWLHVKTGTEMPQARWFSKNAVENLNWSSEDIQEWVNKEYDIYFGKVGKFKFPPVPRVDVAKKFGNLNDLNLSNSSDEGNQDPDAAAPEHMVESTVKIGEKDYKLSQLVKCATDTASGNLIRTKYRYLNPIVSKIDGKDIHTQPGDATSTAASDAEGTDKK